MSNREAMFHRHVEILAAFDRKLVILPCLHQNIGLLFLRDPFPDFNR